MTKLQRLRSRALDLLKENADKTVPMFVDYTIDDFLRDKLDLPDRPRGAAPYEGWLLDEPMSNNTFLSTSSAGIDLIKKWEGFRSKAYLCPAQVWTIGYGHTKTAKPGDSVTKLKAEQMLKQDLHIYEHAVRTIVKVPLNQNQFDALVSFCYNVGTNAFRNSTLVKQLNLKQYSTVRFQLSRWNKANGRILPGLVSRREDEGSLFDS